MASLATKTVGTWTHFIVLMALMIPGLPADVHAGKVDGVSRRDRKTKNRWTTSYRLNNGVRHTISRSRTNDRWVVDKIRDSSARVKTTRTWGQRGVERVRVQLLPNGTKKTTTERKLNIRSADGKRRVRSYATYLRKKGRSKAEVARAVRFLKRYELESEVTSGPRSLWKRINYDLGVRSIERSFILPSGTEIVREHVPGVFSEVRWQIWKRSGEVRHLRTRDMGRGPRTAIEENGKDIHNWKIKPSDG